MDGNYVHNHFKLRHFVGGAHHGSLPKVVPEGEIWVRRYPMTQREIDRTIAHELIEAEIMRKNPDMSYRKAHNMTEEIEKAVDGERVEG